jgi:hypothetical protein
MNEITETDSEAIDAAMSKPAVHYCAAAAESEGPSLDTLAKAYIRIRDAISAKTKEYDAIIEGLKEQQKAISDEIKARMQAVGATSLKTDSGTMSMRVDTRYYPQDWDAFSAFVKANDAMALLERRVAQGNLQAWIEQNPDNVPHGLGTVSQYVISVRKPTK